jgi:uncharacterized RDD family membrane protein YckC
MKPRPLTRVLAKFVDLFIVMTMAALLYPVGPLLGFLYSLFGDGLPISPGQSLGKRLFKVRVVSTLENHAQITWRDSLYRNAPVGVATFFALIPVWGWAILVLVGLPMMIIEIYLIVKAPRGQRLGDVMADTEVVSL